jgi:addiction module HigA family antidote
MAMFNPAHPGEILRELVLDPLNVSVSEAALRLGVSRKTLHKLLSGSGSITVAMSLKIESAFPGPDASHWLRLQMAHDLWNAREQAKMLKTRPRLDRTLAKAA